MIRSRGFTVKQGKIREIQVGLFVQGEKGSYAFPVQYQTHDAVFGQRRVPSDHTSRVGGCRAGESARVRDPDTAC